MEGKKSLLVAGMTKVKVAKCQDSGIACRSGRIVSGDKTWANLKNEG